MVIVDKFDFNLVLVNINKLKLYKYMDQEIHNQYILKYV
jgi:hypothetical protein